MSSEDTKILEFNQYQNSDKALLIVYVDLECVIEKIDGCKNNPKNSSTIKVSGHIPSGFSMSTISFKRIENKLDVCRGKDCMKKFCEFLIEHAVKTINFKKKKKEVTVKLVTDHIRVNIVKSELIVIIQEDIEVLRIAYVI